MGKAHLQINLGNTPLALEQRLLEFTDEDRFNNFKVSLVRSGTQTKSVSLFFIDAQDVKFGNGFAIEYASLIRSLEKIIIDEFKFEYFVTKD